MTNDYRNSFACKNLAGIAKRKAKTKAAIQADHPKAFRNHYYISNKSTRYYALFSDAYNRKCAYCGVSTGIQGIKSFEIDHFICEDSGQEKEIIDEMGNLVFSCHECNHNKWNFLVPEPYREILHPDSDVICTVFERSNNYSIHISADYIKDDVVKSFYEQLRLGDQSHRIDYLILEAEGLCNFLSQKGDVRSFEVLGLIVNKLKDYRNNYL